MDDSKLIELVREHPCMFNIKHPKYKDSNVRDEVWAEIADAMKLTGEECRHRWKNIRDTFMRRKRNKKLTKGSVRSKKLRKWHLEEHLGFLNFVDCKRKTLASTVIQSKTQGDDVDEDETQIKEIEEDPDDSVNEMTQALDVSNTGSTSSIDEQQPDEGTWNKQSNKRQPITKLSGENILKLFKKNAEDRKLLSTILAKPTELQQQHPIDVFFQSMAMSVKEMSLESQIRAKMEVCQIVGQLELEEFRKTSSSSSSAYGLPSGHSHGSVSQQSPSSV